MDELNITMAPTKTYTVCNGVLATHGAAFDIFGKTINVHRPVDDKKHTRLHGWQFSVDGVPVSYIGDTRMPRLDAVRSFVIRALSIGEPEFIKALDKTLEKNRRRLDAARAA